MHVCIDENGYIQLPEELMMQLGWVEKTILDISVVGNSIKIERKNEWTPEELQEGEILEQIIEDVSFNRTVHYLTSEGQRFVIAPYNKELHDYYDNKEETFDRKLTNEHVD